MPWWAVLYLVIYVLFTISGISDDSKRTKKAIYISGEVLSAIFVIVFVLAFFNVAFGNNLGVYVFPMLIIGIFHEVMAAKRTMDEQSKKKDPKLTEKEQSNLSYIGLIFSDLFIVPGYVFGLMVGLRNIGI